MINYICRYSRINVKNVRYSSKSVFLSAAIIGVQCVQTLRKYIKSDENNYFIVLRFVPSREFQRARSTPRKIRANDFRRAGGKGSSRPKLHRNGYYIEESVGAKWRRRPPSALVAYTDAMAPDGISLTQAALSSYLALDNSGKALSAQVNNKPRRLPYALCQS